MKSLDTIQKTFKVFKTLAKIGMILSFVWAGLVGLGILCGLVWRAGGAVIGAGQETLLFLTAAGSLRQMIGALLCDLVFALTDGALFLFAFRYFGKEQTDGTPFTRSGADQIKRLGIRTIVLPLVATILAAVFVELFELPQAVTADHGSLSGVSLGIVLILASLVFRYGAELEEKREGEETALSL